MSAQRADLAGLRVLIADDELLCAMVIEEEVQDMGGQVVGPVSSVDEIVAIAIREKPDIAVLDINMKGQLSYPAAMELIAAGVPVVFTTGYDGLLNCPDPLKEAPLLTKPWVGSKLGEALTSALAQKR
jgi:CheY-like chemotaxis protein